MKPSNKLGSLIFALLLLFFAMFLLFSDSGSVFMTRLLNSMMNSGPLMMIISIVGLIGFIMLIGFLFGMPVPGKDIIPMTKDNQNTETKGGEVTVDITIGSGFRFGIGFMLGVAVTGVVLIPLLLIVISSVLSGLVGKL